MILIERALKFEYSRKTSTNNATSNAQYGGQ